MFGDVDPFTAPAGELLACLVDLEPGPFVMSALLMVDRSALSADDAVTFLQLHERVASWWASVQVDALVAAASPRRVIDEFTLLDPRPGYDDERTIRIEDAARDEIASALRWSSATAHHRIAASRMLAGPLASTAQALSLGEISPAHAAVIVEAAGRLPGRLGFESGDEASCVAFTEACIRLQARVVPVARRGTLSMTRTVARRAVLAIDAEGERRRRLAARCTRAVYVVDDLDGISTLIARMSTEAAHAVMSVVDACAESAGTAPGAGMIGERRAEALAQLVLGGTGGDGGGVALSAHLDLVVDLATLLDLHDALESGPRALQPDHGRTGGSAMLRGVGPVSVDVIRELVADPAVRCTMRRLVTDPLTGHLLDVGRQSYDVPSGLRRFVAARDQHCRFPGCRRRAARCQLDHATAWDDGGATSAGNLGALCVRHHQLKTHAGWEITESRADGSCTWRSPLGRVYEHPPEPALL